MNEYQCPVCGTEWYKSDLGHLNDIGCPGCSRRFDLHEYMHEDEPLWHDWREKCYDRMTRQNQADRDTIGLLQFKSEMGL
jgi:uncharacterized Zn finger protein (UPF0148 family)